MTVASPPAPPPPAIAAPAAAWRAVDPDLVLVIETNRGRIVVVMEPRAAPAHVARIQRLAHERFYDGQTFFRVIGPFMDQTGDPQNKGDEGGSRYGPLKAEFTFKRATEGGRADMFTAVRHPAGGVDGLVGVLPVHSQPDALGALHPDRTVTAWGAYCPGVVGMARDEGPDTADSQFFLMREAYPSLEGRYTAWGRVVQGLDVVRAIKTGEPVPAPQDRMISVRLLADLPEAGRPKVEALDPQAPAFAAAVRRARAARAADFSVCDVPTPRARAPVTVDPAESSVITTVEAGLRSDGEAERLLRRRLGVALIVGVLSMTAMIGVAIGLFLQNLEHGRWVDHTYAAQAKISDLATDIERVETARRGALLNPSDPTYRKTYNATVGQILPEVDDLAAFTHDNPRQRANIDALRPLIASKRIQLISTMDLIDRGRADEARALFIRQAQLRITQQMRTLLAAMDTEEQRLLKIRSARERATTSALLALTLSSLVLLGLVVAFAGLLVWRYAADLNRSQAALRKLNEGLEGAVRDRTAELTRANAEIQRFAYIVSHDLRSPLVNVMGFTSELETTMGVLRGQIARTDELAPGVLKPETRAAVFEDMPEAIGFIRSSTRKMDRLINAILALSRQGRRTLNPEPLDMDALAQGVADSLRQLADDRGAKVEVAAPLPEIVNDRLAIEQVLSNLTENAVKYASPDRPGRVTIQGRSAGARVVLEVVDNGRGVAPRDHERIFDLFRRSGAQDQPGEGIGLAHVRALVYRLGGTISVESELGQGATFRIDLPRRLGREDS